MIASLTPSYERGAAGAASGVATGGGDPIRSGPELSSPSRRLSNEPRANGVDSEEDASMGLIIILVIGALVGWVAGMIMRSGGGILFDIVIGIVGALIAGFLFGGGASIINAPLNVTSILFSLLGAIILLAVVKLIRRAT
jgi:uncharacterized membrane protein YeaQ/YmgE (transglycosylase-associated protein family)